MNTGPLPGDWLRLTGVIGIEIGLLGLLLGGLTAMILRRRDTSAVWPRTLWRGGVLGVIVIAGAELMGARVWLGGRLDSMRRAPALAEVRTNLDPTLVLAPQEADATAAVQSAPRAPAVKARTGVWWPAVGWLAGTVVLLGRMVWARGVFAWVLRREGREVSQRAHDRVVRLANALGFRRRIHLSFLDAVPGPVACGLIFPTIVLPNGFEEDHSESSQDAMLMHELAHVSARDAIWHAVADFAAALLWWHPAVWWIRRRMLAASELAADEACRWVADGPRVLAECLVSMARRWVSSSPVAGWQGIQGGRFRSGLGHRVQRLLECDVAGWRPLTVGQRWLGRAGVTLALAGIAVLGAALTGQERAASWAEAWRFSIGRVLVAQVWAAESEVTVEADAPIVWQPWSRPAVDAALNSGRPVLIFFTADWCVTGQVSQKTALDVPEVRRRLRELQAVAFKADWTSATNAAIEKELKAHGRATVPLTVVASASSGFRRIILPEILTPELVLRALDGKPAAIETAPSVASLTEPPPVQSAPAPEPSDAALANLVTSRLFEARSLYAAGLMTEAEAKLRMVLKDDPKNQAAQRYLELIKSARPSRVTGATRSIGLNERLDSIVLESFGGTMPLGEMVMRLFESVKAADPDGKGINFIVNPGAGQLDPATGLPVEPQDGSDLQAVMVQVQPAVRKATVRQILHAILQGSGGMLRYEVADYAVIFAPAQPAKLEPEEALHTRGFRIGAPFKEALAKRADPDSDEVWPRGRVTAADELLRSFRSCLRKVGVTFPPTVAGRNYGRSLFFNDRSETIMVRATLRELDLVEQVIQELNTPPPQVLIEARIAEVPTEVWPTVGLDWVPISVASTNNVGWDGSLPLVSVQPAVGVLAPFLAGEVLRALEKQRGATVLTTPKITTLSGRQAQVKVVNVRYVVTGTEPVYAAGNSPDPADKPLATPLEMGPVLDVVPTVMADRTTIALTLILEIKEFIGYDPAAPSAAPRPVYRSRRMAAGVTVWDGQTAVLHGGDDSLEVVRAKDAAGNVPSIGGEFQAKHTALRAQTKLVLFVTARLIDAAGERIRRDEDIPVSVPKQKNIPLRTIIP